MAESPRAPGPAPLPDDPVPGGGWPLFWLLGGLLLAVPFVELWLMFTLPVGLGPTLAIAAATAALGWWAARREDLSLWSELEEDVRNRRVPTPEALDAMLAVLGGWGLMVPGYLTDLAGLALLVPAVRRALLDPLRQTIRARLE